MANSEEGSSSGSHGQSNGHGQENGRAGSAVSGNDDPNDPFGSASGKRRDNNFLEKLWTFMNNDPEAREVMGFSPNGQYLVVLNPSVVPGLLANANICKHKDYSSFQRQAWLIYGWRRISTNEMSKIILEDGEEPGQSTGRLGLQVKILQHETLVRDSPIDEVRSVVRKAKPKPSRAKGAQAKAAAAAAAAAAANGETPDAQASTNDNAEASTSKDTNGTSTSSTSVSSDPLASLQTQQRHHSLPHDLLLAHLQSVSNSNLPSPPNTAPLPACSQSASKVPVKIRPASAKASTSKVPQKAMLTPQPIAPKPSSNGKRKKGEWNSDGEQESSAFKIVPKEEDQGSDGGRRGVSDLEFEEMLEGKLVSMHDEDSDPNSVAVPQHDHYLQDPQQHSPQTSNSSTSGLGGSRPRKGKSRKLSHNDDSLNFGNHSNGSIPVPHHNLHHQPMQHVQMQNALSGGHFQLPSDAGLGALAGTGGHGQPGRPGATYEQLPQVLQEAFLILDNFKPTGSPEGSQAQLHGTSLKNGDGNSNGNGGSTNDGDNASNNNNLIDPALTASGSGMDSNSLPPLPPLPIQDGNSSSYSQHTASGNHSHSNSVDFGPNLSHLANAAGSHSSSNKKLNDGKPSDSNAGNNGDDDDDDEPVLSHSSSSHQNNAALAEGMDFMGYGYGYPSAPSGGLNLGDTDSGNDPNSFLNEDPLQDPGALLNWYTG